MQRLVIGSRFSPFLMVCAASGQNGSAKDSQAPVFDARRCVFGWSGCIRTAGKLTLRLRSLFITFGSRSLTGTACRPVRTSSRGIRKPERCDPAKSGHGRPYLRIRSRTAAALNGPNRAVLFN